MVIKVWHIRTEARFHRALKKINIPDQRAIIEFLETLELQSPPLVHTHFKKLTGRRNQGRFDMGNYRIGVDIDYATCQISLRYVGTRENFYKKFRD